MSQNAISSLVGLQKLARARTAAKRKLILDALGTEIVRAICESIANVLNKNVDLSEKSLRKLARQKEILRFLKRKKRASYKKKKTLIIQKGGAFLPLILPPVVALLGEILAKRLID